MTSKHHRWQTRWQIDRGSMTATHESGLVVRLVNGQPRAENGPEIIAALTPKNGHNASAMVARMMREAAALLEGRPYADR